MHVYRVGEPYSSRASWDTEGIEYHFREGAHEMRIVFAGITPREQKAVTRAPFDMALVPVEEVLFVLTRFRYDNVWNDSPYTWHLVPRAQQKPLPPIEPGAGLALVLFLVEATNNILQGIRLVAMPTDFAQSLHGLIRVQQATPFDPDTYDRRLAAIYREYPRSQDLLPLAVARHRFSADRSLT